MGWKWTCGVKVGEGESEWVEKRDHDCERGFILNGGEGEVK
jgi:hypothetical protein